MRCIRLMLYLMLGTVWIGGCGAIGRFAQRRADKAAYTIIAQKQRAALGQAGELSIDPGEDPATRELLERAGRLDWANDNDTFTTPSMVIGLSETLALAVANNRDYKTQRENLYKQALELTETRRNYGQIYNAAGSYNLTHSETGEGSLAGEAEETFGTRSLSAGVNQVLATGATVALNFSHQFVHYFDGAGQGGAANNLSLSVVQPLLRGAGTLVALEPLRQDERNMIYAVRAFRRYQQQFIIEVATNYYALLSAQDQLHNAASNYNSAQINWRRLRRFADGGKVSAIDVDQARQKVLEAEAGLAGTQKDFCRQLDQFKVFLGLPLDLDIGPDHSELEKIAQRGLLRPDMTLRQAVDTALSGRLDLANSRDAVEDSTRTVKIALQNFLPTLDLSYNISTSKAYTKDRAGFDFKDYSQQVGIATVLPLDWTPRRNIYRVAQIDQAQAERAYELARQNVMLEVRDAWRELEEARTNYRIQEESMRLAERQVKSTAMLLQMGRATTRDLLDAQDGLLVSSNAVTSALVRHTITRLRFWNTIERLEIDPKGMWYDR